MQTIDFEMADSTTTGYYSSVSPIDWGGLSLWHDELPFHLQKDLRTILDRFLLLDTQSHPLQSPLQFESIGADAEMQKLRICILQSGKH